MPFLEFGALLASPTEAEVQMELAAAEVQVLDRLPTEPLPLLGPQPL